MGIYYILQLESVQTYLAHYAAGYLSKELNTIIRIDKIKINFFTDATLEGIYLEDLHRDTLLYSAKIEVKIGILSLFGQKLNIEKIDIKDTKFHMRRYPQENGFNFQFIIDYFAGDTSKKTNKPSSFKFGISKINIENAEYILEERWQYIKAYLPSGALHLHRMNLPKQELSFHSIDLKKAKVSLLQKKIIQDPKQKQDPTTVPKGWADYAQDLTQKGWTVLATTVRLDSIDFSMRNEYTKLATDKRGIDFPNMDLKNIKIEIQYFDMKKLDFRAELRHLALEEKSGFKLLDAKGEVHFTSKLLDIKNLELVTPYSKLRNYLRLEYNEYEDFKDFVTKVNMYANIDNSQIKFYDIFYFAPILARQKMFKENEKEEIKITGVIKDKVENLKVENAKIQIEQHTHIEGDFAAKYLTTEKRYLDIVLDTIRTDIQSFRKILPEVKFPDNIKSLGNVVGHGEMHGLVKDFLAKAELRTDIGYAKAELHWDMRQKIPVYQAGVKLIKFNIGKLLDNKDIGEVSLDLDNAGLESIVGRGVQLQDLDIAVKKAIIPAFTFKKYTYKNIAIENGHWADKVFKGEIRARDENVNFTFKGLTDFKDKQRPIFDFVVDIDTLNLQNTNLLPDSLSVSGTVHAHFYGMSIDSIIGTAAAKKLAIRHKTRNFYFDSLFLSSYNTNQLREVEAWISPNIRAKARGIFQFSQISDAILGYFNKNFPEYARRLNMKKDYRIVPPQDIEIDIHIPDSRNYTELIHQDFHKLATTRIKANFNSTADSLGLNGILGFVHYQNFKAERIKLRSPKGRGGTVDMRLFMDKFFMKDTLWADSSIFHIALKNDTVAFDIGVEKFRLDSLLPKFRFKGHTYVHQDGFEISLDPSAISFLGEDWDIRKGNKIRILNDRVVTKGFRLLSDKKYIIITTEGTRGLNVQVNTGLDWLQKKANITYNNIKLNGNADITLVTKNIFRLDSLKAIADIDNFTVNNDNWGKIIGVAHTNNLQSMILLDSFKMEGERGGFYANGFFNAANSKDITGLRYFPNLKKEILLDTCKSFYIKANADELQADLAEYFLGNIVDRVKGIVNVKTAIWGTAENPHIMGEANLKYGKARVKYLNTTYTFNRIYANIDDKGFHFKDQILKDSLNNPAVLNGHIVHDKFKDFGLEAMEITADKILALNTKRGNGEAYFGTAIAKAKLRMYGHFNALNMNIEATSLKGTTLSLPLDAETATKEAGFVKFVNKKEKDSKKKTAGGGGINVDMKLTATPDAEIKIIFDESTGDIMSGKGNGDLQITYSRAGVLNMYGGYTIKEGVYNFSYQNLISKPFKVVSGGTVKWGRDGDPFGAEIDIQATYQKKGVVLSPLIASLISDDGKTNSKGDVLLTMNLSGELFKPNIGFGLTFSNIYDPEIITALENVKRLLNNDANILNRQVFGLIVLGGFLPLEAGSSSGTNVGSAAINTFSEMLSSQLSNYLSGFLSDVVLEDGNIIKSIDVDVKYNESGNSETKSNDLQVGVGAKLGKDNRWAVNVGGNFDLSSSNNANIAQQGTSTIAGNFVVEYLLTRDGNLKIKAYSQPGRNTQGGFVQSGIALSYRTEFDNFSEFLSFLKKKAKEK